MNLILWKLLTFGIFYLFNIIGIKTPTRKIVSIDIFEIMQDFRYSSKSSQNESMSLPMFIHLTNNVFFY